MFNLEPLKLLKKDRARFWKELKLWFFSAINWPIRLKKPVKCNSIKMVKRSLVGHSFYFFDPYNYKVRSPLKGCITKIYLNNSIHITGQDNIQIILTVQLHQDKDASVYDVAKCQVREGQEVDESTVLYVIFFEKQVQAIIVLIPWQPQVLKRVIKWTILGSYFANLNLRSPWTKPNIIRHGRYD